MIILNASDVEIVSAENLDILVDTDVSKFVKFDLSPLNVSNFAFKILYFYNSGYRNFVLNFEFDKLTIPYSRISELIRENLYKLLWNYNINVAISGIPRCIFESQFLYPGVKFYYDKQLLFLECFKNDEFVLLKGCKGCLYENSCSGANKYYVNLNGRYEFKKMQHNKEFLVLNKKKMDSFKNLEIRKIGSEILSDYAIDKEVLRKRFVFVDSFPNNLEESSVERFVYYIYNRREDFNLTYGLMKKHFDHYLLAKIEEFLVVSNQIVLSFGAMGDSKVRKTFYFSIEDLNKDQVSSLSSILGVGIKFENLGGVAVDYKGKNLSFKIYYQKKEIDVNEINDFFDEFDDKKKLKLKRFLDLVDRPLKGILFDYKYKIGHLFSKRVDISMQFNDFDLEQVFFVLDLDKNYFIDKELYTVSFEISENYTEEKINVYYVLK